MKIADKLERRLLGMAHVLCLIALVGAVLAMIALMFALAVPGKTAVTADPPLSASEVLSSIPGSEAANDALSNDSANGSYPTVNVPGAGGFLIPAPLRTVLSQDNASQLLLEAWLASVPPTGSSFWTSSPTSSHGQPGMRQAGNGTIANGMSRRP